MAAAQLPAMPHPLLLPGETFRAAKRRFRAWNWPNGLPYSTATSVLSRLTPENCPPGTIVLSAGIPPPANVKEAQLRVQKLMGHAAIYPISNTDKDLTPGLQRALKKMDRHVDAFLMIRPEAKDCGDSNHYYVALALALLGCEVRMTHTASLIPTSSGIGVREFLTLADPVDPRGVVKVGAADARFSMQSTPLVPFRHNLAIRCICAQLHKAAWHFLLHCRLKIIVLVAADCYAMSQTEATGTVARDANALSALSIMFARMQYAEAQKLINDENRMLGVQSILHRMQDTAGLPSARRRGRTGGSTSATSPPAPA